MCKRTQFQTVIFSKTIFDDKFRFKKIFHVVTYRCVCRYPKFNFPIFD